MRVATLVKRRPLSGHLNEEGLQEARVRVEIGGLGLRGAEATHIDDVGVGRSESE